MLDFHNKYPDEAFEMDACNFISDLSYDNEIYSQYFHYVPKVVADKAIILRKYFSALDTLYKTIPKSCRLRKTDIDFCDFAINKFQSFVRSSRFGFPVVIGSGEHCALAWLTINSQRLSRNTFDNINSLINHYIHENFGECCSLIVAYKKDGYSQRNLQTIADEYKISINKMLSVIISFTFDIVVHGGPDCDDALDFCVNEKNVIASFGNDVYRIYNNWRHAYFFTFDNNDNTVGCEQSIAPLGIGHGKNYRDNNFVVTPYYSKVSYDVVIDRIKDDCLDEDQTVLTLGQTNNDSNIDEDYKIIGYLL